MVMIPVEDYRLPGLIVKTKKIKCKIIAVENIAQWLKNFVLKGN